MMNKWKELEIDNLPPDILTGGYEFAYDNSSESETNRRWLETKLSVGSMIERFCEGDIIYRYRKPEPKQPSHEEIMSKWWESGQSWKRVLKYSIEDMQSWYTLIGERSPVSAEWFTDLQSADIPPEA